MLVVIGLAAILFVSCMESPSSVVQDLTHSRNAGNQAVVFGAPTDLPGIDRDIEIVREMLESQDRAFGFNIKTVIPASSEQIVAETKDAARRLGPEGTLFWYFSGHGDRDGNLVGQPGEIDFRDVANAIKEVRDRPVRRLVVVIDACYSGQMVNGDRAIQRDIRGGFSFGTNLPLTESSTGELSVKFLDAAAARTAQKVFETAGVAENGFALQTSRLAEELIVVSASSRNNTAQAGADGSKFTKALSEAFDEVVSNNGTLADFMDKTVTYTQRNSRGHHTPQHRFAPMSLVGQRLMDDQDEAENEDERPTPGIERRPTVDSDRDEEQLSSILAEVNSSLRGCHLGFADDITSDPFRSTRRNIRLLVSYRDRGPEQRATWFDHENSIQQEVDMFLRAIPRDFFTGCESADGWQGPEEFREEWDHIELVLDVLNSKVKGCAITASEVSSHSNPERYSVELKATFADLRTTTRSSWSQLGLDRDEEANAFLRSGIISSGCQVR